MAKANAQKGPMKNIKLEGKRAAKEAAYSPLMDHLTRLGYGIKGVIYILMGLLAFQGATGKSHTPADQLGAIVAISKLPYGKVMLWVVLIGLISYALWGLIRAFLDPFYKGRLRDVHFFTNVQFPVQDALNAFQNTGRIVLDQIAARTCVQGPANIFG